MSAIETKPRSRTESNWNFNPLTPSKTPGRRRLQMAAGITELAAAAVLLVPATFPALMLAADAWRRLEIKANEGRLKRRVPVNA